MPEPGPSKPRAAPARVLVPIVLGAGFALAAQVVLHPDSLVGLVMWVFRR